MPYVVVDTCVLSYLYSGHDQAAAYHPHVADNTKVISFMTLAELHYGALKNDWGEPRRTRLLQHVTHEYVIFPFDRALCLQWARVRNHTEHIGRKLRHADSWIAATAMLYNMPLVAHNRRHFEVLEPNLRVISES
jgi:tRNA(fMet)-specific endonuclease VapC